jgi:hypothetical protein
MVKYVAEGSDDLEDKQDILELMMQIKNKFRLKAEAVALEKKANPKHNHSGKNLNKEKGESKGEQKKKNPCRKHDGWYEYKDCPDHKDNKDCKPKSKHLIEKGIKKDLHSTKADNVTTSKTMPMVTSHEEKNKNHYANLVYSTDEGSAMMVQTTNKKQVNGITVVEAPARDGTHHATTILIDNCFTGYTIMSHSFVEKLSYEFQHIKGELYHMTTDNMNTSLSVSVKNIELPHLNWHRTLDMTFKVAP